MTLYPREKSLNISIICDRSETFYRYTRVDLYFAWMTPIAKMLRGQAEDGTSSVVTRTFLLGSEVRLLLIIQLVHVASGATSARRKRNRAGMTCVAFNTKDGCPYKNNCRFPHICSDKECGGKHSRVDCNFRANKGPTGSAGVALPHEMRYC